MSTIRIHYHRPPDREELFIQRLVRRTPEVAITYLERTPLARAVTVDGRVVLEDGSPVVWFTFPGLWHDIGRFHRADGTFTGLYANVLTPVQGVASGTWATTDLYLDVWRGPDGDIRLLDEDELAQAVTRRWIDDETAAAARREGERILALARTGAWPPPVVETWTLGHVRRHLAGGAAADEPTLRDSNEVENR